MSNKVSDQKGNKNYYNPQYDDLDVPDHFNYRNQNKIEHKSGYVDTISNILKSQIGGSMLALPFSMMQCGIGYGIIINFLTVAMMLYSVHKLVRIADDIKKDKMFYPELVEQILGPTAGSCIAGVLASLSIGSCVSYIIFFRAFVSEAFYYAGVEASQATDAVIILAILIPFIFINNFHFLSKSSAFAILLMFFTIGYILVYDMEYIKSNQDIMYQGSLFIFSGIPSYLGVAIFASEGIPCVFHIRDSMQKPQHFIRVFTSTVGCVCMIYIIFTLINIFTFGDSLNQIVLMNIPYTTWASFLAKIGFATAILLSYPIQIFPVYSMVEKSMLNISKTVQIEDLDSIEITKVYGVRLSLLASVFLLAFLIPQFAGILNVLGAVSGIIAQFIIPIMMDNVYNNSNKPTYVKIFDYALIGISCFFAVICGYISTLELFQ